MRDWRSRFRQRVAGVRGKAMHPALYALQRACRAQCLCMDVAQSGNAHERIERAIRPALSIAVAARGNTEGRCLNGGAPGSVRHRGGAGEQGWNVGCGAPAECRIATDFVEFDSILAADLGAELPFALVNVSFGMRYLAPSFRITKRTPKICIAYFTPGAGFPFAKYLPKPQILQLAAHIQEIGTFDTVQEFPAVQKS